ncbi:energy transducer TonB [Hymenobacter sp. DH14]|uniref:Energy transducer TonB n=1 Tax=Hymenobacter cyanobacteriorum TaxID=2926463 RepID=A0A9X1VIG9_9BACT|nr:energy transducer TonB [Hymenobacter cyanobacteriorum]MCI1187595.1 energy transducer TonB [Hymenobacter cyanobacteriorum]
MLAWLKKLVGGAENPPPTPPAAGPVEPYRTEETSDGGLVVRRTFNCHTGPEWLAEQLETGLDEAGQPWQRRTWYFPWGPVRRQRTHRGNELLLLCYFPNEELRLRRQTTDGHLTDYYCCEPLASGTYTEQMPRYPGGDTARVVQDIQRAFKYPAVALRNQEEGRVKVGFVVSPAGLVTDIHIIDSVSPSIDDAAQAAVMVVGQRRWKPGLQNRRAVAVSFTIPITCRIA